MIFHWPQALYLMLCAIGIGIALQRDGQPRTGQHSFVVDIAASCPAWGLLYCGGFFS